MSENISISFPHSEANSKSSDSVPNAINQLMQCLHNHDVEKMKEKLNETNLAQGTINIILNKAFSTFRRGNPQTKEIIQVLLSYGADPNLNLNSYAKDKKGQNGLFTGLMLAAAENDVELASILVTHCANVNIKDSLGRNALFYALNSTKGDIKEMILFLIRNEINVNESDNEGQTALTMAVNKNLKVVVKILLDNGADVDHVVFKDGNTAIHYGVIQNKQETIKVLLTKKPNLAIRNRNGEKAVDIAAQISNRTDIYSLLAEEYANQIKKEGLANNNANVSVNSNNSNELMNEDEGESGGILSTFTSLQQNLKIEKNTTSGVIFQGTSGNSGSGSTTTPNPSSQANINQASSTTQNINISINNQNNLLNFQEIKRNKNPSSKKSYHKQMKIEHSKSMKDYVYKFPLQNNISRIEIPFNFQNNLELNSTNSINTNAQNSTTSKTITSKGSSNNQFHSFIKLQNPPTLFLDISDETKQDKLALSCIIEELKVNNFNQANKINSLEANFYGSVEENEKLKMEISKLKEELEQKDGIISDLTGDLGQKEVELSAKTSEFHEKLEERNLALQLLHEKYEKLEKELLELKSRDMMSQQDFSFIKEMLSKKDLLEKKFSCSKYDDKYIIKCLQKDLIDFQEYSKEQIRKVKASQEELLRLIQESVNECIPEYEVKLYGSHATNLCLYWSDLDLVLIHRRNFNVTNYGALQTLYINLMEKTWKKSIKFIDTAMIPIIKMTSGDQFNSMHIDISLQDSKHYGLRCVDLVKSFMKEYEALEPLIFALKNILRNANLNDPYTVEIINVNNI